MVGVIFSLDCIFGETFIAKMDNKILSLLHIDVIYNSVFLMKYQSYVFIKFLFLKRESYQVKKRLLIP
jgi:hypothetical protein